MSARVSPLALTAMVAGILVGLAAATVAVTASGAHVAVRPRTLVATRSKILAFAQDGGRIAWIARARLGGGGIGCRLHVRTLGTSRTVIIALRKSDCAHLVPGAFALGAGSAAWADGFACATQLTCLWTIKTVAAAGGVIRVVARDRVSWPVFFDPQPQPLLAGAGRSLVYTGPTRTVSIAQGKAHPLFRGVHVFGLAVGGGQIATSSPRFVPGDGCGCLDVPAWSPDGRKIAVLQGRFLARHKAKGFHVAVMNADGTHRRAVVATTNLPAPGDITYTALSGNSLSWSPNGKKIAYDGAGPAGDEIGIVATDGSGHLVLGQGASPAWSPDGSKIAFTRQSGSDSGVFVMNPDGSDVHELVSFGPEPLAPGLAWSPDGTRIAFSLQRAGLEVMNADGSDISLLAVGGEMPSWSPDGSQIAFKFGGYLAVIGADGSGVRQLTHHGDCCEHPSWSPDGTTIALGGTTHVRVPHSREPGREIYTTDADGGQRRARPLTFTRPPRWALGLVLHSATGRPSSDFSVPLSPYAGLGIALRHKIVAVGSHPHYNDDVITLINTRTKRRIASVRLAYGGELSLAGANAHWFVFKLGNTISALKGRSRQVLLTKVSFDPLDLSVSGRRVAWAENINGHGRIRALELPN